MKSASFMLMPMARFMLCFASSSSAAFLQFRYDVIDCFILMSHTASSPPAFFSHITPSLFSRLQAFCHFPSCCSMPLFSHTYYILLLFIILFSFSYFFSCFIFRDTPPRYAMLMPICLRFFAQPLFFFFFAGAARQLFSYTFSAPFTPPRHTAAALFSASLLMQRAASLAEAFCVCYDFFAFRALLLSARRLLIFHASFALFSLAMMRTTMFSSLRLRASAQHAATRRCCLRCARFSARSLSPSPRYFPHAATISPRHAMPLLRYSRRKRRRARL